MRSISIQCRRSSVFLIFGSLFGTIGIILAVPAIAAGKIVFNNIYADMANASLKATP